MAGSGSIENRGNGSWRLTVSAGEDNKGKRIRKRKTVKAKNKTEARKKLAGFITEVEAGEYIASSGITFEAFVNEWEETWAKKNLNPKTLENYNYIIRNYMIEEFGNKKLENFHYRHIYDYLESLEHKRKDGKEGGLSSKTIQSHYRILNKIFKYAVHHEILKKNPVAKVTPPKVTLRKTDVYTEAEVYELFDLLEKEPIHQRLIIKLALSTGLRRGEILGLQWDNIDLEEREIEVIHSLQYINGEGFNLKEPKTASSIRKVAITKGLAKELREYQLVKKKERLQAAELWEGGTYDFVFSSRFGKPLYPTVPGTWWRRFLKRTGFKKIRFHDLRHTAATFLIGKKEHPKIISERLGHSDIKTTMNVYGHYIKEADRNAADLWDDVFNQSK